MKQCRLAPRLADQLQADRPTILIEAFSNLTSGLLGVAEPAYAGATMALYSCIGFGGGFLGTVLFGVTLDGFGGAGQLRAWIMSFGTSAIACLTGAAAMIFLSGEAERKQSN
jgi:hypothetical protein